MHQVCINAVDASLFCDERLTLPVGSWQHVQVDVFARFMDKFGPQFLSTVMYAVSFPANTPYSQTALPRAGTSLPWRSAVQRSAVQLPCATVARRTTRSQMLPSARALATLQPHN
jgi:hypothetical protein